MHAIGQGDFNCVPNKSLDVRHTKGSQSVYPNSHANILEAMLAAKGLEDTYRTYAGTAVKISQITPHPQVATGP